MRNKKPRSSEEHRLVALQQALDRLPHQNRVEHGLKLPDIVAYLPPAAIHHAFPNAKFTTWRPILDEYYAQSSPPSFKPFAAQHMGVNAIKTADIRRMVDFMAAQRLEPEGELGQVIRGILARADD